MQVRGYLEDDKKFLRPTELGFLVIDALLQRFSFVEYAFTRDLEQQLDDIAEGKAQYLPVVSAADERLQAEIAALAGMARPASARAATGWSSGGSSGVSASARPGWSGGRSGAARLATPPVPRQQPVDPAPSRTTLPSSDLGSTATAKPARTPRTAKRTGAQAASSSAKTAGKKTRATATRSVPKTPASGKTEAPIPCPVCKAGFVRLPREDSKAWSCSNWSETKCGLTVWRTVAGRELSSGEVETLCRKGQTGKLTGFISKAGRPFEASLKLTGEGKVEFVFGPR